MTLLDRYGLPLSTASSAARDAYVAGCDLMFTFWPGAAAAFARATAEDPSFALAHLGAAQMAAVTGDMPGMQTALAAAHAAYAALSEREASQRAFLALLLSGQSRDALAAARIHLAAWPRDAVVMNHYGTVLGLIQSSGLSGAKRAQEEVMDSFAHHYGDDWWFVGHHAMALSERGRRDEARAMAERSLTGNPRNAIVAHSRGHIGYEDGEADAARGFLSAWLADYPRDGLLHGHLSWHLALAELATGDREAAFQRYSDSVAPGCHQGPPRMRVFDAIQFLWRWELAGNPRDPARWQALDAFAHAMIPTATSMWPDFHIVLADAMAGDGTALALRLEQMEELERAGRYPDGGIVPAMARGMAAFAQADYAGAIAKLSPLLAETERLGGSWAQLDLIDFTVLRACVESGRLDELQHRLSLRRTGPARVPVSGVH